MSIKANLFFLKQLLLYKFSKNTGQGPFWEVNNTIAGWWKT